MTNLEAIKAKVGWNLSTNSFTLALTDRGLTTTDTYTATSEAFELTYADCLIMLLSSPQSESEGGYSISSGDRSNLQKIADAIYRKYDDARANNTGTSKAKFVQRW